LNLETKKVDFCRPEAPRLTCGNGILDSGEECDDGNSNNGDGCSSTCTVELGWMCSNTPYATRSLCQRNECGDSYINALDPFNEVCDDGDLVDTNGCTKDCKTITPGWYCGRPGKPCSHVCSNSLVDYKPGPPFNLYQYIEACDDGNTISGDGITIF